MIYEKNNKAKTIIEKIRRLLMNYDLAIVEAKGTIELKATEVGKYKTIQGKKAKSQFIKYSKQKQITEIYLDELITNKNKLLENLNIILDKYQPRYKEIFVYYFLENKNYDEIADLTCYSKDTVNKIIQRLKSEIIDLYVEGA